MERFFLCKRSSSKHTSDLKNIECLYKFEKQEILTLQFKIIYRNFISKEQKISFFTNAKSDSSNFGFKTINS